MAIDLKTLLPDTTFGSGAFLFGADSQSSSTPSIYGVDDVFGYLLGLSNTWTGQQTFATGSVIFGSGNQAVTSIYSGDNLILNAYGSYYGTQPVRITANGGLALYNTVDEKSAILTYKGDNNIQLGNLDNAQAIIPQIFSVQSVESGGAQNNIQGANFTIRGSAGTGQGAGGNIIFQVAPLATGIGSDNNVQNSFETALTIGSDKSVTFSGSPNIGNNAILGSGGYYLTLRGGGISLLGEVRAVNGFAFGTSGTTQLREDAANTLALRNGANAQTFNIYNTFTNSTNYERFSIIAQSGGAVQIGTNKGSAGGTAQALELQTDGQTRFIIDASGNSFRASGSGGAISLGSIGNLRTRYVSNSGNNLNMFDFVDDATGTATFAPGGSAPLLRFGGTTSSFPALKRDATTLKVRLADDSGDAPITASTAEFSANVAVNGANTSQYNLSVDGSFGVFDGSNTVFTVNDPTTTKVLEVVDENDNELFSVNNSTTGTLLEVINGANDTVFSVNSNTDGALLEVTSVYDDTVFTVNSQTTGPILEVSSAYGDNLLSVSDKGSVTVNGVTATANDNVLLDLSQTWDAGANTVSGINLNVTDTSSNTASTLMDLKVGGSSKFSVDKSGTVRGLNFFIHPTWDTGLSGNYVEPRISVQGNVVTTFNPNHVKFLNTVNFGWTNGNPSINNLDLILTRKGPANLRLGAADVTGDNAAANLKAQTLSVQSVATGGTLENVVGKDFTIQGSAGTGSGAGGSIIFQVAPAGSSGTGQNTPVSVARISPNGFLNFPNLVGGFNGFRFQQAGVDRATCAQNVGGDIIFSIFDASGVFQGDALKLYSPNRSVVAQSGILGFATDTSAPDLYLYRDTSNTLALRNGGTSAAKVPQTFNIYNYYASATDFERGFIKWNSDAFTIGTDAGASSGTVRDLNFSAIEGSIHISVGGNNSFSFQDVGGGGRAFKNRNTGKIQWTDASSATAGSVDLEISRSSAGVAKITDGSTGGGSLEFLEQTAPAAGGATSARIFAENDSGTGKTKLMVQFGTGAPVQIAIEP